MLLPDRSRQQEEASLGGKKASSEKMRLCNILENVPQSLFTQENRRRHYIDGATRRKIHLSWSWADDLILMWNSAAGRNVEFLYYCCLWICFAWLGCYSAKLTVTKFVCVWMNRRSTWIVCSPNLPKVIAVISKIFFRTSFVQSLENFLSMFWRTIFSVS